MKIRRKKVTCEQALAIKAPPHRRPRRPHILFTTLVRILSLPDLWATRFSFTRHRMEAAGEGPYLILMNHSSFLDLKIASRIFWPMPYGIVCTTDGFVGKGWLMRLLGCIPTQKFVTDLSLVMDMLHALHKNKTSVLMFPEAGYSFDGCATALPRRLGTLIKKLDVPVITVITDGAFLRDPLYNGLQLRKTRVSAQVSCLFTKEEIARLSVDELDRRLDEVFRFDNFAEQYKNKVEIREKFRADGLDRILYRCPPAVPRAAQKARASFCAASTAAENMNLLHWGGCVRWRVKPNSPTFPTGSTGSAAVLPKKSAAVNTAWSWM